ncbi:hypothetical protein G7043_29730 [Lentzea sp. NEAU-D13]|uniref:Uncharacterized protein n=1 Tax=Lentzea alba TaxID=2714351 RepID=A0A7C9RUL2_9PSEU|nr:hypothetical protein [Lentzea alba]NGY63107.1 hypothetical protein [Lentzea alba]
MTASDRGIPMAHLDQLPATTAIAGIAGIAGIAEPHQSTVASIQHAAGLGLFSAAEAELVIDRIRALTTGDPAQALPVSPNETVA